MPAIFHVDQARTFQGVMFLSSAPKMVFGQQDKQDVTRDGTPKWEVQVVATFEQFGKAENEILKVGVQSHSDPSAGIGGPQPVELVNFRVGIAPVDKRVDNQGREKVTGGTAWYQADEVRPLNSTPAQRSSSKQSQEA